MRPLALLATTLTLVSTALAQTAGFCVVKSPGNYETVTAGTTHTVRWEPGALVTDGSQITISLLGGGSPATLQHLGWIQTVNARDGKYDWAIDRSLGHDKVYGLELRDVSNTATFQYSFPFHIAVAQEKPKEQPKEKPKEQPKEKPQEKAKEQPKKEQPKKAEKTTLTTMHKTKTQTETKPAPTPSAASAKGVPTKEDKKGKVDKEEEEEAMGWAPVARPGSIF